jgi:hypothetical protein
LRFVLSPAKVKEGTARPDRDGQFRYLHGLAAEFTTAGDPVISVDTKEKEMVGEYANGGVEWQPAGGSVRVNVHDFVDPELGRAIPYGIDDEQTTRAGSRLATPPSPRSTRSVHGGMPSTPHPHPSKDLHRNRSTPIGRSGLRNAVEHVSLIRFQSHLTCSPLLFISSGLVQQLAGSTPSMDR